MKTIKKEIIKLQSLAQTVERLISTRPYYEAPFRFISDPDYGELGDSINGVDLFR
jgi:hypothetical protein